MFFILLVFFAAFSLEIIGTVVSVIGLTQVLGFDYIIVTLAIVFDLSKIVSVSLLYKEWAYLPGLLKRYLLIASVVLVSITSAGAAGYLASSFQKNILPTKSITVKIDALEEEKMKLAARKIQIDNQIANLPVDMVKGRTKLISNFKLEIEGVNTRLTSIDEELPKLQIDAIDKSSHAGPIMYLAQALNTTPEHSMMYIIGLVVFVFDPLAIALILAGNYLVEKRVSKIPKKEIEELQHQVEVLQEEVLEIEEELQYDNFHIEPETQWERTEEEVSEQLEKFYKSSLSDVRYDNSDVILNAPDTSPVSHKFYSNL